MCVILFVLDFSSIYIDYIFSMYIHTIAKTLTDKLYLGLQEVIGEVIYGEYGILSNVLNVKGNYFHFGKKQNNHLLNLLMLENNMSAHNV